MLSISKNILNKGINFLDSKSTNVVGRIEIIDTGR